MLLNVTLDGTSTFTFDVKQNLNRWNRQKFKSNFYKYDNFETSRNSCGMLRVIKKNSFYFPRELLMYLQDKRILFLYSL